MSPKVGSWAEDSLLILEFGWNMSGSDGKSRRAGVESQAEEDSDGYGSILTAQKGCAAPTQGGTWNARCWK